MMALSEALEIVDKTLPSAVRLNTTDAFKLAEKIVELVNEAFELGRLDKEVVG